MRKLVVILVLLSTQTFAHVPFLKPNQFWVLHNRLHIESSFTELPFQADFAMSSPCFSLIAPDGKQSVLTPTAKTCAAEYLEPNLTTDGTYRIHAGMRKGPKYRAIETADGKLYFADDIAKKKGTMTKMQYFSSADTYISKGHTDYTAKALGEGVEIIPLSSPNEIKPNESYSFQVYENGEPVPHARIVVVYDNEHYEAHRVEDLYDVENVRKSNIYADTDGIFSFTPKRAGLVLLFTTIHHKIDNSLWESYNTSVTLEVSLTGEPAHDHHH
ncbi:MAG: DUF4198 domain-containing protein [Mangrovibacterium sp.]